MDISLRKMDFDIFPVGLGSGVNCFAREIPVTLRLSTIVVSNGQSKIFRGSQVRKRHAGM